MIEDPAPVADPFEVSTHPWWHSAVVYQIYPRSFADSNVDGIGDLPGVIDHLDYLVQLGVDVIWLSPFFVSPQVDNGYDVADYRDVDPMFGTLADLDRLLAAAHERGLRIVVDLVFNHSSTEHPWFVESRDPGAATRDYYYWRPARDGHEPGAVGAEPTNWGSVWGGPAWRYDERSGEYYLHIFADGQADLNWGNDGLRDELQQIARFWLDRGVDGFRFDVINFIGKPVTFGDGSIAEGERFSYAVDEFIDYGRTHAWVAELRQATWDGEDVFTVGEMPGVTVQEARRFTDPERRELDMVFNFEHVDIDHEPGRSKFDTIPLSLPVLKRTMARWQTGLADVGWNSLYWANHDQPRVVSRWGDDCPEHRVHSAKTWATILHLMKGTPYVYQGEELGMINARFSSIEQYRDVESLNYYQAAVGAGMSSDDALAALASRSRDNARTPMPWTAQQYGGFSTVRPWLELGPDVDTINAEAAVADSDSVFHHYRALIALRHELTLISEGDFHLLLPEDETVFAYTRRHAGHVLVVVANCSSGWTDLPGPGDGPDDLPSLRGARMVLNSHEEPAADELMLRPWESRVYLLS